MALAAAFWAGAANAEVQRPAERFSPPGLYDPAIYELDNGLRVILKPRRHIRNVEIRASVGVGQAHFPCGRQQVPHFLEHMLFAAIPGVSESEFEQRMFEIGAYSNAWTGDIKTVYEFSTYSETAPVALGALGKMLFAGELEQKSFQLTRAIIRRESGGEPNLYERWLRRMGQRTQSVDLALRDISARRFMACPGVDTGADVTLEEVRGTYARYYDPRQATVVLVGDFDVGQARAWIETAFGDYSNDGAAAPAEVPPADGTLKQVYRGVAPQPGVGLVARTDGYLDSDYYALVVMSHYLDNRMYQALRVETGLTYTPEVYVQNAPNVGLIGIYAELPPSSADRALRIIRSEIDRLAEGRVDEATFQKARRSLLLNWAQGTETNAAFADYYVNSLGELDVYGRFRNEEVAVAELDPEGLQRVASRVFADGRTAILRDEDFDGRQQMLVLGLVGALLLVLTGVGVWVFRRRRR